MNDGDPEVEVVGVADVAPALDRAVARAKASDVMAPVWVVVASGVAAGSALNDFALQGGAFNLRFVTLANLAHHLTASLDLPARLPSTVRRELIRLIALEARKPLADFEPSLLAKALVNVFGDLSQRSPEEIARLGDVSTLTAELVRLFALYRHVLAGRYVDDRDLLAAAADFVATGTSQEKVVVLLSQPPTAYENELLNALHEAGRLSVVAVKCGIAELDSALDPWLWGLGAQQPMGATDRLPVDRIVLAPDPDAEIQVAVAELLRRADDGVAFARMAILFPHQDPYARIINDQLRQATIPARGSGTLRLSQTITGGFVMRLFDVIDSGFSYESVASWLLANHQQSAADWLRIARRARVAGDPLRWVERLQAFADGRTRFDQSDVDAATAREFADFLRGFDGYLQSETSSWKGWAEWLQRGIETYLASYGQRVDWPSGEEHSAVRVETRIAIVAELDAVGGLVDRALFIRTVGEDLATHSVYGGGRSGVFVGSVSEAVGANFDVVVLCGLADGWFPSRPSTAGLTNVLSVPGEEHNGARDRRNFRLRIDSGGYRVLTVPAADVRSQRPLRPSPLVLEEAGVLAEELVSSSQLQPNAEWPWLGVYDSFTQIVAEGGLHSSLQFDDVHSLLSAVAGGSDVTESDIVRDDSTLSEGIAVLRDRDSEVFTRFDGLIGQPLLLTGSNSESVKVTALERWAQCPFRYLLDAVLGVEYDDDDDALLTMTPRDRGQLVHSVLETFMKQVSSRLRPEQPWDSDERQLIHAIVDQHFAAAVKRGVAPDGFTTEVQRAALHRHLEILLDDDERRRVELGVVPVAVEQSFGFGGAPGVAVNNSKGEPVWFRGRIDRVDAALDGSRAVVIDYKTGKAANAPSTKDDPLARGRSLQLGVYGKAVQRMYPNADVQSEFWYVTDDKGGYKRSGIQIDDEAEARITEVFDLIADSFEAGAFPAVPGEDNGRTSFQHCRNCPYDPVCPRDRAESWARKASDTAVAPFVRLSSGSDNV